MVAPIDLLASTCNITTCPVAREFGNKFQWGKLNKTLT